VLWPLEYEELRAEAQEMALTIRTRYAELDMGSLPADPHDRVAAQRAMAASFEVVSTHGADEMIADVPCRTFKAPGDRRGTYLHFHGGAMIMGSARMNDSSNARIAESCSVDVVSVDYRLAPEHPFPAAPDDCLAVARALLALADVGPIVMGGESSGAYLAATTLLRIRDELGAIDRIRAANLVFGVYDLSGTPSNRGVRPSAVPDIREPDPDGFTRACYLPGWSVEQVRDPEVSPLYASLERLPPALFTVGSADRLLDDTLFMARRWEAYGNDVELAVYPDCGHTFTAFPMELARRANGRIDSFLAAAFAVP
jgi:acetyl esterase